MRNTRITFEKMKEALTVLWMAFIFILFFQGVWTLNAAGSGTDTRVAPDSAFFANVANWKIQSWKGNGSGTADPKTGIITVTGGKAPTDDTIVVLYKPKLNIPKDGYLNFSVKMKGHGIQGIVRLYAAVRNGGLQDLQGRMGSGDFDWQEFSLQIHPADVVSEAAYIGIRLQGPGELSIKDMAVVLLGKEDAEKLKAEEASKIKADRENRIEKLMQSYKPTLPLASDKSVQLFKIWGTRRPAYEPLPHGWKEVEYPAEEEQWEAPADEKNYQAKGYTVFSCPNMKPVGLDYKPSSEDFILPLRAFSAPGEYEPIAFSVRAFKDLNEIRVSLNELKSDKGKIGASNIDVRTQGYRRMIYDKARNLFYHEPFLLEKGPDFIEKDTTRNYWITVKVPDDAPPGIYTGKIELSAEGVEGTKIPVHFRVLPFKLPPLDATSMVWWERPTKEFLEQELIDQREHGMTTTIASSSIRNRSGVIGDAEIKQMADDLDIYINLYKKVGFTKPLIGGHSNHYIVFKWDRSIGWFRMDPITPELDSKFLSVYKRLYLEEGKKRNWPEILHYVFDEPGGSRPEILPPAEHYLKILKENFPQLKTFVTFGGGMAQGYDEIAILGPYLDYWCVNRWTPEIAKRFQENKKEVWLYNGGGNSKKNRFFYGVYSEKNAASGTGQWIYSFDQPFKEPFVGNHGYVYHGDDGPLPSSQWENIREGVKDRRYMQLLKDKISLAEKSGKPGMQKNVEGARKLIENINSHISDNYQSGADTPENKLENIDYTLFDTWRWAMAEYIMEFDGSAERNVLNDSQKTDTCFEVRQVAAADDACSPYLIPVDRKGKAYEMAAVPKIDGLLSDGEWDSAGLIDDFIYAPFISDGNPLAKSGYMQAPLKQNVHIGYDAENLYLAFENPLPEGASPKADASSDDGNAWADDDVEYFIKPGMGPSPYWVFIANSSGRWLDGKGRDASWNGEWEKASSVKNGRWCCEMRIPWKNFDLTPDEGAKMLMNFGRNTPAVGKYASWSPIKKGAHEPEKFGLIELSGKKKCGGKISLVRLVYPTFLKKGENTFTAIVENSGAPRKIDMSFEISKDGKTSDKSDKNLDLPQGISEHNVNIMLDSAGECRLKIASPALEERERNFILDFTEKQPLKIILRKDVVSRTDGFVFCKIFLNQGSTGGKISVQIVGSDGKVAVEDSFATEKNCTYVKLGIANLETGRYRLKAIFSGNQEVADEKDFLLVGGY